MRSSRLAAIVAIALLGPALAVGVAADDHEADGGDGETVTVTVAPTRVGDAYRVREDYGPGDGATRVVTVGEPETARDRYGVERSVVPFLVQRRVDGDPVSAERCMGARGHVDTVQRIPLLGEGPRTQFEAAAEGGAGGSLWTDENPRVTRTLTSFDADPCHRRNPLGGQTLEEGDRIRLADVWPQVHSDLRVDGEPPLLSAPAEPTTFHGRDALRFTFPDTRFAAPVGNGTGYGVGGTMAFVVADGLPGVVRADHAVRFALDVSFGWSYACAGPTGCGPPGPAPGADRSDPSWGNWDFSFDFDLDLRLTSELAGFERGDGPALEAPDHAPLVPPSTPHGGERGVGLQPAYATGFEFPYTQEEAWRDVLSDPYTTAYRERHPDAYVTSLTYDVGKRPEHPEQATTDGGWTYLFQDDERAYEVTTTQVTGAETAAGSVDSPRDAPVKDRDERDGAWPVPRADLPAQVPDGEALAAPVAAHGVAPDEVRRVHVAVQPGPDGEPSIAGYVTNVSYADPPEDARGVEMRLDVRSGGLAAIRSTEPVRQEEGPWAGLHPSPVGDEADTAAFGLPAGPESGAGLAATGAAGVGLLALLTKFVLLPLYARIRRERLLDNPVRATLHERAADEPGIHQAALVEAAGVGKGAALHHLRKLVDADLLARFRQGGYVRYYVPGEVDPDAARREAVLRAGSNRRVWEVLSREPGLSLRDVAEQVGVSAPTVHRSVEQLREAGLLDESGRPVAHVEATPAQA